MKRTMLDMRAEAKQLGHTTFRTERPCTQGHEGIYYVASGQCVDCAKRNARKVYQSMKMFKQQWEDKAS